MMSEPEKRPEIEFAKQQMSKAVMHDITMTGAILAALQMSARLFERIEVVVVDGLPINQIEVKVDFLDSPYRLTIERVRDGD